MTHTLTYNFTLFIIHIKAWILMIIVNQLQINLHNWYNNNGQSDYLLRTIVTISYVGYMISLYLCTKHSILDPINSYNCLLTKESLLWHSTHRPPSSSLPSLFHLLPLLLPQKFHLSTYMSRNTCPYYVHVSYN